LDIETTLAINLGLGIKISEKVAIRPEYRVLLNLGEDGCFGQFSMGVTINRADKSKLD
jgi:hypothetical protein